MADYEIKSIKELKRGNIVLHPIFRPDGLLLINRYKSLTESIILHIQSR